MNTSPFKFLDSYHKEDGDIFFGRKEETKKLYEALSGLKHLLVYGPSGAGKTSLIECGLRNRFSDADWFALSIRRGNNITGSIYKAINEALENKLKLDFKSNLPFDKNLTLGNAIQKLFAERFQPVYLLFDQFEELLLLGEEDEKKDFFRSLNKLIHHKVPCRVMLIMREEFIGHLSEFEYLCPSIFQHRFRLEKMGKTNVRSVISSILNAEQYKSAFKVEDSEGLTESILDKLPDESKEIELTYVQVFLSELWDRANKKKQGSEPPVLKTELIKDYDKLEKVLDSFLKKQLTEFNSIHGEDVALEVLAKMISKKNTKIQITSKELTEYLKDDEVVLKTSIKKILSDLKEKRIIRSIKSGDKTKFEISHDLLALVVGKNKTDKIEWREKAAEVYRVYEERENLLSKEDLDYIRPFKRFKDFSTNLSDLILKSEKNIKLEEKIKINEAEQQAAQEKILRNEAEQERLLAEIAKKEAEAAKIESDKQKAIAELNEKKARRISKASSLLAFFIGGLAILTFSLWRLSDSKEKKITSQVELLRKKEDSLQNSLNKEQHLSFVANIKSDSLSDVLLLVEEKSKQIDIEKDRFKNERDKAILAKKKATKSDSTTNITLKELEEAYEKLKLESDSKYQVFKENLKKWAKEKGVNYPDNELIKRVDLLYFVGQNWNSLPETIFDCKNLKTFIWTNSLINPPPNDIEKLQNLSELFLPKNNLEKFPEWLGNMGNLVSLNLDDNKLANLSDGIRGMGNLEILYLRNNRLTSLPEGIGGLKNLKELNLNGNKLESLPEGIGGLESLKELDLSFHLLTWIPKGIRSLGNLERLDLHGNQLANLPEGIGGLKNLKELNLNGNKLESLPEGIGGLESLETLDLHGNQLMKLPKGIEGLKKLKRFFLHKNQLTSLPEIRKGFDELVWLSLSNNQINSLPEWIGDLDSLKWLDLDSNQLTSLPKEIKKLIKLESLALSSNDIKSLPEWIGDFENLKRLYLGDNHLASLPEGIGGLESLETLDLYRNQLTSLPEGIKGLKNLEILDLADNQLANLPEGIGDLESLKELDLTGNNLSNDEKDRLLVLFPNCLITFE